MDQAQDFKSLQDQIQKALISTTKLSGHIAAEDLGFQRSLNPAVAEALDEQSERLLALASALIKSAVSISELKAPTLQDADDVENNWRNVVDVVDSLLEKSDTCLDEYTGRIKRKDSPTSEQSPGPSKKPRPGNAFRTQNLVKPQLIFETKPDNFDTSPWKPFLTTKPHATVPLEKSLNIFTNDFGQQQYLHPYKTEIEQLKYPESMYQKAEPIPYLPVDTTSAIFVDTEEAMMDMLEELKSATEIAIDLEHHDARSYIGLVSLMQISTRNQDWIVDTLKPWRQNLQVLNEVFADPKIIKVFHGAFMDIGWLQRDLGLYVVGLFDTHWASKTLGYAGGSLAFLLKKFINFDADKQYQLADWRIRPLPEEMFFYARADTHFLLYIYDMMRNELVDRSNPSVPDEDRIEMVLQKSKEVSLIRFERQSYNSESGRGPGGWYSLLVKTPALFNKEQFSVFRTVHEWRDRIARTDDDSPTFIMPQHVIFSIAKIMPMDLISLLGLAHPVSYSIKSRAQELLDVVKSAKARGNSGPSMIDVLRPDSLGAVARANIPAVAEKNSLKKEAMVAVIDDGELRSDKSSFWGGAFGSSMWDAPTLTHTSDIRLAVPLPALSSELFAGNGDNKPTPKPIQKYPEEEEENIISFRPARRDETFTLKSKPGEKRKVEQISSASDAEVDVEERKRIERALSKGAKAERRAEKKAAKLNKSKQKKEAQALKKAAAAASSAGDDEEDEDEDMDDAEDEEEAFDYSKAESVLHGKRADMGKKSKGKGKDKGGDENKPFDPYSKSADAPKGMRRAQTERAGRSHTFKN